MTREQMIEQMARMLCYQQDVENCTECCRYNSCLYRLTAEEIYNAGFRKQSEARWNIEIGEPPFVPRITCSKCALSVHDSEQGVFEFMNLMNFCPNCGAKMKGAYNDQQ